MKECPDFQKVGVCPPTTTTDKYEANLNKKRLETLIKKCLKVAKRAGDISLNLMVGDQSGLKVTEYLTDKDVQIEQLSKEIREARGFNGSRRAANRNKTLRITSHNAPEYIKEKDEKSKSKKRNKKKI